MTLALAWSLVIVAIVAATLPLVSVLGLRVIRAWRYAATTPQPALASLARAGLSVAPGPLGYEVGGDLDGHVVRGLMDDAGLVLTLDVPVRGCIATGNLDGNALASLSPAPELGPQVWCRSPAPAWAEDALAILRQSEPTGGFRVGDGSVQLYLPPTCARDDLAPHLAVMSEVANAMRYR